MDLVRYFEQQQVKDMSRPRLRAGDVVRVESRIQEGDKTRLQTFEGTLLSIRGSGPSTTFTVRREVSRFAVERIFPLYSPLITNIEIVKRQKVRRAKLTYLREEGRRRVKEDERSMQLHVKEEADKKRLVEQAAKAKAEAEEAEKRAKEKAEKAAEEAKAQATETPEKKEAETTKSETDTKE